MTKKKITIIICTAIIIILCAAAAIILLPNKSSVSVTEMLSTAQKYLIETEYERAIAEFNKVIELDPMNAEAYLGLAEAYEKNGQHDMAVETLEKGYEATGDDRIKAALEALLSGVEDITVTAAPQTAVLSEETSYKSGDTVSLESYSDGTKRSEMIYTDDNGAYDIVYYFYQGAELLRESYSAEGDLISAAADFSFVEGHPIGEILYKDLTDISESGYTLKRGTTSVNVSGDRALFSFADNDMYGITYRSLTFDDDGNFIYKCNNMGLYLDPYSCVTSYYTDGKTESTAYYNDTVVMGTSAGTFELSGDSYKTDRSGSFLDRSANGYRYTAECADGIVTQKEYSRSGRYLGYTEEYTEDSTLYSNYYYANGELNIHSEYDADSGTQKNVSYYDGEESETIIDHNNGIWTTKAENRTTSTIEFNDNIQTIKQYDENGELYSEFKTDFVNRTTKQYYFGNDYYIDTKDNWYYDDNGVRITETYDLSHYDWKEEKEIYYDEPFHSSTEKFNYITGERSETHYDFDGSITSVSEEFSNDDGVQINENRSSDGILLSKSEYDTADGSAHTYQYDENGTLINEETH